MLIRQEGLWKFWPITATEVGKSGVTGHLSSESTHGNSVQTRTKYERQVQVNLNTSPVQSARLRIPHSTSHFHREATGSRGIMC
jgi:hypothetical protein